MSTEDQLDEHDPVITGWYAALNAWEARVVAAATTATSGKVYVKVWCSVCGKDTAHPPTVRTHPDLGLILVDSMTASTGGVWHLGQMIPTSEARRIVADRITPTVVVWPLKIPDDVAETLPPHHRQAAAPEVDCPRHGRLTIDTGALRAAITRRQMVLSCHPVSQTPPTT